jgi:hypothetical protein
MSDRFPSISPDGQRIAVSALPRGGQAVQFVGNVIGEWQPVPVEFDASGGVWQTPRRLVFARNTPGRPGDGAILAWEGAAVTEVLPPGIEGWSCHNGHLSVWTRSSRIKAVTTSREGHIAGLVDLGGDVILEVDGVEIDRGPIAEPRYTGEALVWVKWVDGIRRIFGRRQHDAPTDPLSVFPDDEFWPLAIETPLGLFVMTHGHPERGRPLFLRPWGEKKGHIVATGITDRPDARALERGLVLVAFSDLITLRREFVNLAAPLVDVRGPIVVPPVDPPPPDPPPVNPPQEISVRLEQKHSDLIEAFAAQFGLPGLSKEDGQAWVAKLAGTFKARWPSEDWGTKRASMGRPLSNESIARRANGRLWGYDLIIGAGAPGQTLASHAHAEDITDQVFVEVESRDWLAGSGGTPTTPGTPPPATPPPSQGRAFPAFTIPPDVFLVSYRTYIGTPSRPGVYARDRFMENHPSDEHPEGTFIGSTGSLMWYIPIFTRLIIEHIAAHGNTLPTPDAWWALGDRAAVEALAFYRKNAPPE